MACKPKKKKMACGGRVKKRRKMESGGTVSKPKKKDTTAKADSTAKKPRFAGLVGVVGIPTPPQLKKKNWSSK